MGSEPCVTPKCAKRGTMVCPTCKKLGIPSSMSTFCSQDCFKGYWPLHKGLHKMFAQALESKPTRAESRLATTIYGNENPAFHTFKFTGTIRPGIVSPLRQCPDEIPKPEYWETGIPVTEQLPESNTIRPYTKEQIEGIRYACRIGRKVLDTAGRAVRIGITGEELDQIVQNTCIELGCYPSPLNYYNFPKSFCLSVNEIICHGIPDSRPIEDGDIVNLDISVFVNGYHADLNETFLVGNVDEDGRKLVQTAFECLKSALEKVKPGVMYRELGKYITATANEANCSVVKTYCGHGIGMLFHTVPTIPHYAKNKAVGIMRPGHIFTIEPMINLGTWKDITWPDEWTSSTADGKRSAQFEHTILVTETGYEILTMRENEPTMVWDEASFTRS